MKPAKPLLASDAIALHRDGKTSAAKRLANRLIAESSEPREQAAAHHLLAIIAEKTGRGEIVMRHLVRAVALQPDVAELRLRLADRLFVRNEVDAAIEHYKKAVELRPRHAATLRHVGRRMLECERYPAAAGLLHRLIGLGCDAASTHFNLATALAALRRVVEAIHHFELVVDKRPDWLTARFQWLRFRAEVCDWRDDWDQQVRRVVESLAGEREGDSSGVRMMQCPALAIPSEQMRSVARRETAGWLRIIKPANRPPVPDTPGSAANISRRRLRIGYMSADFRNHATGHLVRSMFGHHDRDAFEVFAYSHGIDDKSDYRNGIESACEHFVDLYRCDDEQIANRIISDRIDVLVDLMGYAGNGRPGVLARRPAPLIIHYLGFPSTLGGLADYYVTDETLTPRSSAMRNEFQESLIYLPHTYQMTDDRQRIQDTPVTRAEFGLPANGFVFAAFNSSYKIQPATFATWMKILGAVPRSTLWMVGIDQAAVNQLRMQADRRGIDPRRLVFSEIADKPNHLARHRLANLFLDTTVCGAHTTATDALWAGVPVLTCPGKRFTERVAASLLTSLGLEELIVDDLFNYKQKAIELAKDPSRCAAVTDKLAVQRKQLPLFKTAMRVKELEVAYQMIWRRYQDGQPPTDLFVPPQN